MRVLAVLVALCLALGIAASSTELPTTAPTSAPTPVPTTPLTCPELFNACPGPISVPNRPLLAFAAGRVCLDGDRGAYARFRVPQKNMPIRGFLVRRACGAGPVPRKIFFTRDVSNPKSNIVAPLGSSSSSVSTNVQNVTLSVDRASYTTTIAGNDLILNFTSTYPFLFDSTYRIYFGDALFKNQSTTGCIGCFDIYIIRGNRTCGSSGCTYGECITSPASNYQFCNCYRNAYGEGCWSYNQFCFSTNITGTCGMLSTLSGKRFYGTLLDQYLHQQNSGFYAVSFGTIGSSGTPTATFNAPPYIGARGGKQLNMYCSADPHGRTLVDFVDPANGDRLRALIKMTTSAAGPSVASFYLVSTTGCYRGYFNTTGFPYTSYENRGFFVEASANAFASRCPSSLFPYTWGGPILSSAGGVEGALFTFTGTRELSVNVGGEVFRGYVSCNTTDAAAFEMDFVVTKPSRSSLEIDVVYRVLCSAVQGTLRCASYRIVSKLRPTRVDRPVDNGQLFVLKRAPNRCYPSHAICQGVGTCTGVNPKATCQGTGGETNNTDGTKTLSCNGLGTCYDGMATCDSAITCGTTNVEPNCGVCQNGGVCVRDGPLSPVECKCNGYTGTFCETLEDFCQDTIGSDTSCPAQLNKAAKFWGQILIQKNSSLSSLTADLFNTYKMNMYDNAFNGTNGMLFLRGITGKFFMRCRPTFLFGPGSYDVDIYLITGPLAGRSIRGAVWDLKTNDDGQPRFSLAIGPVGGCQRPRFSLSGNETILTPTSVKLYSLTSVCTDGLTGTCSSSYQKSWRGESLGLDDGKVVRHNITLVMRADGTGYVVREGQAFNTTFSCHSDGRASFLLTGAFNGFRVPSRFRGNSTDLTVVVTSPGACNYPGTDSFNINITNKTAAKLANASEIWSLKTVDCNSAVNPCGPGICRPAGAGYFTCECGSSYAGPTCEQVLQVCPLPAQTGRCPAGWANTKAWGIEMNALNISQGVNITGPGDLHERFSLTTFNSDGSLNGWMNIKGEMFQFKMHCGSSFLPGYYTTDLKLVNKPGVIRATVTIQPNSDGAGKYGIFLLAPVDACFVPTLSFAGGAVAITPQGSEGYQLLIVCEDVPSGYSTLAPYDIVGQTWEGYSSDGFRASLLLRSDKTFVYTQNRPATPGSPNKYEGIAYANHSASGSRYLGLVFNITLPLSYANLTVRAAAEFNIAGAAPGTARFAFSDLMDCNLPLPGATEQTGKNPALHVGSVFEANMNNFGGTCWDKIQNNKETGVDCGGPYCTPCPAVSLFFHDSFNYAGYLNNGTSRWYAEGPPNGPQASNGQTCMSTKAAGAIVTDHIVSNVVIVNLTFSYTGVNTSVSALGVPTTPQNAFPPGAQPNVWFAGVNVNHNTARLLIWNPSLSKGNFSFTTFTTTPGTLYNITAVFSKTSIMVTVTQSNGWYWTLRYTPDHASFFYYGMAFHQDHITGQTCIKNFTIYGVNPGGGDKLTGICDQRITSKVFWGVQADATNFNRGTGGFFSAALTVGPAPTNVFVDRTVATNLTTYTGALPSSLQNSRMSCQSSGSGLLVDFAPVATPHIIYRGQITTPTQQSDGRLSFLALINPSPTTLRPYFVNNGALPLGVRAFHFIEMCLTHYSGTACPAALNGVWHGYTSGSEAQTGQLVGNPFNITFVTSNGVTTFTYMSDANNQSQVFSGQAYCKSATGNPVNIHLVVRNPFAYNGFVARLLVQFNAGPPGMAHAGFNDGCYDPLSTVGWGPSRNRTETWHFSKDSSAAFCFDRKQNGDETGVDCGGSSCSPCLVDTTVFEDNFTRADGPLGGDWLSEFDTSGCAKPSNGNETGACVLTSDGQHSMIGTWATTKCERRETECLTVTQVTGGMKFTLVSRSYSDDNCTNLEQRTYMEGMARNGGRSPLNSSLDRLIVSFTKRTIAIYSADSLLFFRGLCSCTGTNWTVGTTVDITKCCPLILGAHSTQFGLIRVLNNVLYTNDLNSNCTKGFTNMTLGSRPLTSTQSCPSPSPSPSPLPDDEFSDGSSPAPAPTVAFDNALVGSWISQCKADNDGNSTNHSSVHFTAYRQACLRIFANGSFTRTEKQEWNSCGSGSNFLTIRLSGTVHSHGTNPAVNLWKRMSVAFTQVTARPDSLAVQFLQSMCNCTTWTPGVASTVTLAQAQSGSCRCGLFPSPALYINYQASASALTFAYANDSSAIGWSNFTVEDVNSRSPTPCPDSFPTPAPTPAPTAGPVDFAGHWQGSCKLDNGSTPIYRQQCTTFASNGSFVSTETQTLGSCGSSQHWLTMQWQGTAENYGALSFGGTVTAFKKMKVTFSRVLLTPANTMVATYLAQQCNTSTFAPGQTTIVDMTNGGHCSFGPGNPFYFLYYKTNNFFSLTEGSAVQYIGWSNTTLTDTWFPKPTGCPNGMIPGGGAGSVVGNWSSCFPAGFSIGNRTIYQSVCLAAKPDHSFQRGARFLYDSCQGPMMMVLAQYGGFSVLGSNPMAPQFNMLAAGMGAVSALAGDSTGALLLGTMCGCTTYNVGSVTSVSKQTCNCSLLDTVYLNFRQSNNILQFTDGSSNSTKAFMNTTVTETYLATSQCPNPFQGGVTPPQPTPPPFQGLYSTPSCQQIPGTSGTNAMYWRRCLNISRNTYRQTFSFYSSSSSCFNGAQPDVAVDQYGSVNIIGTNPFVPLFLQTQVYPFAVVVLAHNGLGSAFASSQCNCGAGYPIGQPTAVHSNCTQCSMFLPGLIYGNSFYNSTSGLVAFNEFSSNKTHALSDFSLTSFFIKSTKCQSAIPTPGSKPFDLRQATGFWSRGSCIAKFQSDGTAEYSSQCLHVNPINSTHGFYTIHEAQYGSDSQCRSTNATMYTSQKGLVINVNQAPASHFGSMYEWHSIISIPIVMALRPANDLVTAWLNMHCQCGGWWRTNEVRTFQRGMCNNPMCFLANASTWINYGNINVSATNLVSTEFQSTPAGWSITTPSEWYHRTDRCRSGTDCSNTLAVPTVKSNAMCVDAQGLAVYHQIVSARRVIMKFEYRGDDASSVAGVGVMFFESPQAAISANPDSPNVVMAGCMRFESDEPWCVPIAAPLQEIISSTSSSSSTSGSSSSSSTSSGGSSSGGGSSSSNFNPFATCMASGACKAPIVLPANRTYKVVVEVGEGRLAVRQYWDNNTLIFSIDRAFGAVLKYYGVLFNTEKSNGTTCVDNFKLSTKSFGANNSNVCVLGLCRNGGTCSVVNNQPKCTCHSGYFGQFCEISPCAFGKYKDGDVCVDCPAGKFSNTLGATKCTDCPPRSFNDQAGRSSCVLCGPGTANSQSGQVTCVRCLPGTFSSSEGQLGCASCRAGTFSRQPGSKLCSNCGIGNSSSFGAISCARCKPGFFNDVQGGLCRGCPAGTFSSTSGAARCTSCAPGFFSSTLGNRNCRQCGNGTVAPAQGSTECQGCQKNYYSTSPTQCVACPTGKVTDGPNAHGAESCVIHITAPGTPNATVGTVTDTVVVLNVQAPASDGNAPILGYRVRVEAASTVVAVRTFQNSSTSTTLQITIIGLTANTAYSFHVAAFNKQALSPFFGPVSATTLKPAPKIVSFVASDPDNADNVYSAMDTVTITFDVATNEPNIATTTDINSVFSFSPKGVGTNLTGTWSSATTAVITIVNGPFSTPSLAPVIGVEKVAVSGNVQQTSGSAVSRDSASLTGNWGTFVPSSAILNQSAAVTIAEGAIVSVSLLGVRVVYAGSSSLTVTFTVNAPSGAKLFRSSPSAAASSTLTLSGTVAQVNAGLQAARFGNHDDLNKNGFVLFTVVGTDGTNTDTLLQVVHIRAVNDAPVITAPSSYVVSPGTFVRLSNITVSDVDAATGQKDLVRVFIYNKGGVGVFHYIGSPAPGCTYRPTFGVPAVATQLEGTLASVNVALQSLHALYTLTASPPTLVVEASDDGVNGANALSARKAITITFDCAGGAPPTVKSATLSSRLNSIVVVFSADIQHPYLFSTSSALFNSADLGIGSYGYRSGRNNITFQMGFGYTIDPRAGSLLQFRAGVFRRCKGAPFMPATNITVSPPTSAIVPVVEIGSGPARVMAGCVGVSYRIFAQVRSGAGGRQVSWSWTLPASLQSSGVITNTNPLVIPSVALQPFQSYSFSVTASNWLGSTSAAVTHTMISYSAPTPTLLPIGPLRRTHSTSDTIRLGAFAFIPTCVVAGRLNFTWSVSPAVASFSPSNSPSLVMPGVLLTPGSTYTFTLVACLPTAGSQCAQLAFTVVMERGPLIAIVDTFAGATIGSAQALTINSLSYDSDTGLATGLSYSWACVESDGSACTNSAGVTLTFGTTKTLSLPANTLSLGTYTFALTVSKDTRTAAVKTIIDVVSGEPPVVTIDKFRPRFRDILVGSDVLALCARARSSDGSTLSRNRVYTWTVDNDAISMTGVRTDRRCIVFNPRRVRGYWPAGATFDVQVQVQIPGVEDGFAVFQGQVNSAPSGGTFTVSPATGVARSTVFELEANDWTDAEDDTPLRYHFWYQRRNGRRQFLTRRPTRLSSLRTKLPAGPSSTNNQLTLGCYIYDGRPLRFAARTSATGTATVTRFIQPLPDIIASYNSLIVAAEDTKNDDEKLQGIVQAAQATLELTGVNVSVVATFARTLITTVQTINDASSTTVLSTASTILQLQGADVNATLSLVRATKVTSSAGQTEIRSVIVAKLEICGQALRTITIAVATVQARNARRSRFSLSSMSDEEHAAAHLGIQAAGDAAHLAQVNSLYTTVRDTMDEASRDQLSVSGDTYEFSSDDLSVRMSREDAESGASVSFTSGSDSVVVSVGALNGIANDTLVDYSAVIAIPNSYKDFSPPSPIVSAPSVYLYVDNVTELTNSSIPQALTATSAISITMNVNCTAGNLQYCSFVCYKWTGSSWTTEGVTTDARSNSTAANYLPVTCRPTTTERALYSVFSPEVGTLPPPTTAPTPAPTAAPTTAAPTSTPTTQPTVAPGSPSQAPTAAPTSAPTTHPTVAPGSPSLAPTSAPTTTPTTAPTASPTTAPTAPPVAPSSGGGNGGLIGGVVGAVVALIIIGVGIWWWRGRSNNNYRPQAKKSQAFASMAPASSEAELQTYVTAVPVSAGAAHNVVVGRVVDDNVGEFGSSTTR